MNCKMSYRRSTRSTKRGRTMTWRVRTNSSRIYMGIRRKVKIIGASKEVMFV